MTLYNVPEDLQEVIRATEHRFEESFPTKELNDEICLWCRNMVFYILRLAAAGFRDEQKRAKSLTRMSI